MDLIVEMRFGSHLHGPERRESEEALALFYNAVYFAS